MSEFMLALGDTNDLAAAIRKAIGAGTYEDVHVSTPQFERDDGRTVVFIPRNETDIRALMDLSPDMLREVGLQPWGEFDIEEGDVVREDTAKPEIEDRDVLWLFPGEWYNHIPDGMECVDVFFSVDVFKGGETDDDIRYGALSFGLYGPRLTGESK